MFLRELISQGWQALMRDRTRSALTMLGIGWGLVSVVLLLAYGQGLGGCVLHAFLNMGNNVIVLWPGQTSLQAGGQRAGKAVKYEIEDVEAIRDEVPLVRAVSGEIDRDFGFKIGNRVVSVMTRGVDLPYGQMRKLDLDDGRYFNESDFTDHRRVVILGYSAAKRVFQGAPGTGQHVEIGGLDFEVIGTMRNKTSCLQSMRLVRGCEENAADTTVSAAYRASGQKICGALGGWRRMTSIASQHTMATASRI